MEEYINIKIKFEKRIINMISQLASLFGRVTDEEKEALENIPDEIEIELEDDSFSEDEEARIKSIISCLVIKKIAENNLAKK